MSKNTGIPMLKCSGKVLLNGEEFIAAKSMKVEVAINSSSYKSVGDRNSRDRIINGDPTTTITNYKVNKFALNLYKDYISKGLTPNFKIVGQVIDEGSGYFSQYKKNDTITIKNAIPTGNITLFDLEAASTDFVEETLTLKGGDIS